MSNGSDPEAGDLLTGLANHWAAAGNVLDSQREEIFGTPANPAPTRNAGEWMSLMAKFSMEWASVWIEGARVVASGGKPKNS